MKVLVVLLVLVAVGAGYYYLVGPGKTSGVTVTLSEQNTSGESGTARLEEVDGKVLVTISVKGQPAGSVQPAHIHLGACPTPGAVVHPLTSLQNSTSVTTLDTTLAALKAKLPLAINLHKSAAQSQVYIACGDIAL